MSRKKTGRQPNRQSAGVQAPYVGLLAEPMPVVPLEYDPDRPPWLFEGTPEKWREHVVQLNETMAKRYVECIKLLCRHFGIDWLASDMWRMLAIRLIYKHVPAFKHWQSAETYRSSHIPKGAKKRKLNAERTLEFIIESEAIRERIYRQTGNYPLDATVARKLEQSGVCKEVGLKFETIRKLFPQIRSALSDYHTRRANTFQCQLIEQVIPALVRIRDKYHQSGKKPNDLWAAMAFRAKANLAFGELVDWIGHENGVVARVRCRNRLPRYL